MENKTFNALFGELRSAKANKEYVKIFSVLDQIWGLEQENCYFIKMALNLLEEDFHITIKTSGPEVFLLIGGELGRYKLDDLNHLNCKKISSVEFKDCYLNQSQEFKDSWEKNQKYIKSVLLAPVSLHNFPFNENCEYVMFEGEYLFHDVDFLDKLSKTFLDKLSKCDFKSFRFSHNNLSLEKIDILEEKFVLTKDSHLYVYKLTK